MSTTTQKNTTVQNTQEQLDRWEREIAQLDDRINHLELKFKKAEYSTREKAHKLFMDVKSKRRELSQRLEQARSNGSDAWDEMKTGFENSWKEIETAFNNARQAISNN